MIKKFGVQTYYGLHTQVPNSCCFSTIYLLFILIHYVNCKTIYIVKEICSILFYSVALCVSLRIWSVVQRPGLKPAWFWVSSWRSSRMYVILSAIIFSNSFPGQEDRDIGLWEAVSAGSFPSLSWGMISQLRHIRGSCLFLHPDQVIDLQENTACNRSHMFDELVWDAVRASCFVVTCFSNHLVQFFYRYGHFRWLITWSFVGLLRTFSDLAFQFPV